MTDSIKFLKAINAETRNHRNVDELLKSLNFDDDSDKFRFLQDLQRRNFISYQVSGMQPEIYASDGAGGFTGINPSAKPLKFLAMITEDGQNHLNEHLSKVDSKRHNAITRWIAGIAAFLTLCSLLWNMYQNSQVTELKKSIKGMEIENGTLRAKLVQIDSSLTSVKASSMKAQLYIEAQKTAAIPPK